jgi:hypothetical protein
MDEAFNFGTIRCDIVLSCFGIVAACLYDFLELSGSGANLELGAFNE